MEIKSVATVKLNKYHFTLESFQHNSVDPVYQLLKQAVEARRNPALELPLETGSSGASTAPIIGSDKWTTGRMTLHSRSRSNASSSGSSASSYLLAVNAPLHASCSGIY